MKLIVAGSRKLVLDRPVVTIMDMLDHINWSNRIAEIVSGMAAGPDTWACDVAEIYGVPIVPFYANWKKYGRYEAGKIRNGEMAKYADGAIIFWDGVSGGSANMIKQIRETGKPYEVFTIARINNVRNFTGWNE